MRALSAWASAIFKAPENMQYRMTDLKYAPVAIATYSFSESISLKVDLQPGNYVIIPTTYKSDVSGEYLLRCISSAHLDLRALKTAPPSVTKKQSLNVELVSAENLPDLTHSYDAAGTQGIYCVIKCGKDKCFTPNQCGPNPTWNSLATFYAKSPYKRTILVEIWYRTEDGDVCVAVSCEIPIRPGNHKVISELMLADSGRWPLSSKKAHEMCWQYSFDSAVQSHFLVLITGVQFKQSIVGVGNQL